MSLFEIFSLNIVNEEQDKDPTPMGGSCRTRGSDWLHVVQSPSRRSSS